MPAAGPSSTDSASKPALLYVAAYLVLTQAMTALLIFAGLSGHRELAADIGVVHAATLATFFAFSGNARNLILTDRASVQRDAILAARMVLLLPLGAAAVLLCALIGGVDPVLVLILVVRRGVEWIGELHLSESELLRRQGAARHSLLLQAVLLLLAAGAIAVRSDYLLWVLAVWALLPVAPLARFVAAVSAVTGTSLRKAFVLLLPHFGATAASGMSLYAFRVLLVLVAGKSIAGDLFAAFAIGSFPGSMFANVLGPSLALHQERAGRTYRSKALWTVTTAYLLGGAVLLGLYWWAPEMLAATGKSELFWSALGWSLLGGVVMIVAQRVRLRLIAGGDGRELFGADILMHVYLIAAIPTLFAIGRIEGLAFLYALNAALALLFYASGVRGQIAPYGARAAEHLVFITVLLLFLPVSFLVTGQLFNPAQPLFDSGGVLRSLPLPVSLLACSAGLLLYGRYSHAAPALWAIFGLLFLMLVSTAVAGSDHGPLDRAKMFLLLQILLPAFGLVLGAALDPEGRHRGALRLAIFSVVALVVPAQLAATWLEGSRTLGHSVFLFGVYQHLQFVPVILVCAYFVVLPGLWARWGAAGRLALSVVLALVAVYAVAAHAVLAMLAVLAGTALFGAARLVRGRDLAAALMIVAVAGSFGGYFMVAKDANAFHRKFSFLFPPDDPSVWVASYGAGARPRLNGGWQIVGLPNGGELMHLLPTERARQATLVTAGELVGGGLRFSIQDGIGNSTAPDVVVDRKGPFRVEIEIDRDRGDGHVRIVQLAGAAHGTISELGWLYPVRANRDPGIRIVSTPADEPAARDAGKPLTAPNPAVIRNVTERFSDWRLFGHGIFESPQALFFGHSKPLAREQRTSAHNFYVDFVYNFGILALTPLLVLITYTGTLLWSRRREVLASETLFALAAAVAFLVLVESNLKVSLRQPYPGIAIYFFWGLLLARLRDPVTTAKAD